MTYIDSTGSVFTTHSPKRCEAQARCVVHKPTGHGMMGWAAIMRVDREFLVERICPHGVGHPDPDSLWYFEAIKRDVTAGVHGCDGCCGKASDIYNGEA